MTTQDRELGEEPIVISEFGGLTMNPGEDEEWFGYGQFEDSEALLAKYEELVDALLEFKRARRLLLHPADRHRAGNQRSADRGREPKFDPERLRAINNRPSRAVPSEILDGFIKQAVDERRKKRGHD